MAGCTKNSKPTITVVGSFTVDMMMKMERLPVYGEPILGSDFLEAPGGKALTRQWPVLVLEPMST